MCVCVCVCVCTCVCVCVNIDGQKQVKGLLKEKRNLMMLFISESQCEKKGK